MPLLQSVPLLFNDGWCWEMRIQRSHYVLCRQVGRWPKRYATYNDAGTTITWSYGGAPIQDC